jgi:cytochrome P450
MTLFDDNMRRDPYRFYDQLRATSPAFHFAPADLWMLLDYANVKRALTDPEAFSSAVGATRGNSFEWLLFMDPPRHTKLRAIVNRAFTSRSIAALEPRIRELTRGLLDDMPEHVDFEAAVAGKLPILVIAEMLGLPEEDWPRLVAWSHAIMNLADTIMGPPAAAEAATTAFAKADAEMRAYMTSVEPRGLLAALMAAEVDGEHLSPDELARFFQLLLAAGTETTTNLIDNALISLVDHPGELARLLANHTLIPTMLEETLRYRSPAQAMFRATRTPVELNGVTIPAGKMVLTMLGSANRDPAVFANASTFDITREPNAHIAFGHGIHFCLGAPLSRLEARVVFEELLPRVKSIEYASQDPWPPRKPFHVHGPASQPLVIRSR